MTKHLLALALTLLASLSAAAQSRSIYAAPQAPDSAQLSPAPEGYRLVRTLIVKRTDDAKTELLSALSEALGTLARHTLTPEGKRLRKALEKLEKQARRLPQPAAHPEWNSAPTPDEEELATTVQVSPYSHGQAWAARFAENLDTRYSFQLQRSVSASKALAEAAGLSHQLSPFISYAEERNAFGYLDEYLWTVAGLSPDSYGRALRSAEPLLDSLLARAAEEKQSPDTCWLNVVDMHRLISLIGFNNLSDEHVNDLSLFLPLHAELRLERYSNGQQTLAKWVLNGRDKRHFGLPNEMPALTEWRRFLSYLNRRKQHFEMQRWMQTMGDGRVFEPNGMVVWTPLRQGDKLTGIGLCHPREDGSDYGSFVLTLPDFTLAEETTHPDYYKATSTDDATLELTAMSHTGFLRLTSPQGGTYRFQLQGLSDEATLQRDSATQSLYATMPVVRAPGDTIRSWAVVQTNPEADSLAFTLEPGGELMLKLAGSFVSVRSALNNIQQEIPHWEFYDTRMRNVTAWERRMRQLSPAAGTEPEAFAELYERSILPRAISDRNGRYPSFGSDGAFNVKSLGQMGGRPIYERVYADHPLRQGRATMDYHLRTSSLTAQLLNSLLYAAQESGTMNEATLFYLSEVLQPGMQNVKTEALLEVMQQAAKAHSPKVQKAVQEALERMQQ